MRGDEGRDTDIDAEGRDDHTRNTQKGSVSHKPRGGLRRKQTCWYLDFCFLISITVKR